MSPFSKRLMQATVSTAPVTGGITHGQEINNSNTGRLGAANAGVNNYSAATTTLTGTRLYSTTQTIRNTVFTGQVEVSGGTVTFEFCKFAFVPTSSADTGPGYYQVLISGGTIIVNWCDLDTGYRSAGNQGTFACTDNFTANERTYGPLSGSRFVFYRSHIQGCNQAIAAQNYFSAAPGSAVTECFMNNLVAPNPGSPNGHPDSMELRSADNVTVERCRIDCYIGATAHINRTLDWGDDGHGPTIIKDNYFEGEAASAVLVQKNNGSTPYLYNVYITGNRFTGATFGSSSNGHILLASSQNATYSLSYAQANQPVIYWGHSGVDTNVWAPDGVNVVSGQAPGSAVGAEDFFRNGSPDTWNGTLLP